jgi:glyoxylate utilization-related uncharacterized protein
MIQNREVEKLKRFRVVEILEYVPHSVISKVIVKKSAGRVTAVSFDCASDQPENISEFDTLIHVIDGNVKIIIDSDLHSLASGDFIVIPANARSKIKANQRFKMITTVLNSKDAD